MAAYAQAYCTPFSLLTDSFLNVSASSALTGANALLEQRLGVFAAESGPSGEYDCVLELSMSSKCAVYKVLRFLGLS